MSVISWNCRGIGAREKRSQFRKLTNTHKPIFLFIQESKSEIVNPKTIKTIWPEDDIEWLCSPSNGNSGGLISLWKKSGFQIESSTIQRNWIAIQGLLPSSSFKCLLINIYNPCSIEGRAVVWNDIVDFCRNNSFPTLIMGDFNEVLSSSERGSGLLTQEGVDDFRNFIQTMSLIDISCSNGIFTWFHGNRKSKLDRCLVTSDWILQYPNLSIQILNRTISDHCPIFAHSPNSNWGPKPFRFLNCWVSHPNFLPTISLAWDNSQHLPMSDKLRQVKSSLKKWNETEFGFIDTKIKELEDQIQYFDNTANDRTLSNTELDKRKSVQIDLWSWLKKKEVYWAQISRSKWLKEGDRNTKFFHTLASIRRQKNFISSVLIDNTNIVDCAGIKSEAVSYFQKIFQEDVKNRPKFENLEFQQLLPSQRDMLCEPFSYDEIDAAVASCDGNKAPGPDGFNFNFVKTAWEVIKQDVYDMVRRFWNTAKLPKGCNNAFIALVPKIETPTSFKDYRPISMVGCLYKIVSKILARRLQRVMEHLVGPLQSSFIGGRQILDGALVAGEIIESCKRFKSEAVLLKLDFHKAFDSISWSYLDWVLEQMGFPDQWREWMKSCVMSASASILVNGSPTQPIKLQRGLRQGDPLSPFLFNLAVEPLNLLMKKGLNLGLWDGIASRPNGCIVSHLQYADDTIIFCPPSMDYLCNIKKTLIVFQIASGLSVNFHKSALYGINVDQIWLESAAKALLCRTGSLPFKYLGLPIGGNYSRIDTWNPIVDRMSKRLASWKGKMLSIGGRITLIKASLSSLPLYFMSLFPIPKGVIAKLVKIQRDFLWCGVEGKRAFPLVAWEKLERPISLGGLGIGNLLQKNVALLFKWLWRLFSEPKAFWRNFIMDKYEYPSSLTFNDVKIPIRGGPWKAICSSVLKHPCARLFGPQKIRKFVGKGTQTFFWKEVWIGELPLKDLFPRLHRLAINPLATISSLGIWDGHEWQWILAWRRPLRARDIEERDHLYELLKSVVLDLSCDDYLVWAPNKSGIFSVKSASLELAKGSISTSHDIIKGVWRGLVPYRIEIFCWLALLEKINTKSKLGRLGIIPIDEANCVFCNAELETTNHLLLHCRFSWNLWSWWLNLWGLSWSFPETIKNAFLQWQIYGKGIFFKKIWHSIFFIIIWSLWKERNSRIFNNSASSLEEIQDLILLRLCWWIRAWDDRFPFTSSEVIRNPACLKWVQSDGCKSGTAIVVNPPMVPWSPPMVNQLQWNVDASFKPELDRAAVGGVLRDDKGFFICLFSSPIPKLEINSAEIYAIFRALKISFSSDRIKGHHLIIVSDSANAVRWVNQDDGGPWNLNFMLNYIRNARKSWISLSIVHRGRESNGVADALAKQGLSRADEFLAWL
ncbi:uncharacterized protein LOC104908756 [Beta vulgaris subsp. vulgaris]|uniref:uncharacterized protein LOC104908756 n=1 Tax=Beta vulgaris subsp. vulgaris TaxID=3555 RepID=UPI0020374AB6|nr:uncharacterized protein LOC104908756 [Beta vulgaris subsp. vulgaris]